MLDFTQSGPKFGALCLEGIASSDSFHLKSSDSSQLNKCHYHILWKLLIICTQSCRFLNTTILAISCEDHHELCQLVKREIHVQTLHVMDSMPYASEGATTCLQCQTLAPWVDVREW